jgi:hypothetical protein
MMGTLQFGGMKLSRAHGDSTWTLSQQSGKPTVHANAADGPTAIWEEQTLTLTNYMVEDKTVFFGSVQPQYVGSAFAAEGAFNGANPDSFHCNEVVLVTERKLTDPGTDLFNMANYYPGNPAIGGASSAYDPTNIIYGHFRNFGFTGPLLTGTDTMTGSASPYLIMNLNNTWGSGTASANDEVYFYRMVLFGSTADAGAGTLAMGMPEMNIVWTAASDKEEELAYFARIRRSWVDRVG